MVSLLLALITGALYAQVGHFPFTNFDDPGYVFLNHNVQAGLHWYTVRWALTTMEQSNWHPLTWLSHAADCQWFGLNPGAHHLTNLVFHILSVILLFLLLARATGFLGRSTLVAALFALHPINVESVAWVAERKNVLSTFLFLLTLGAYGWYARRPRFPRYLAVAGLFVLALAAKPMAITLPCVLLLLDFWPLRRIEGWTQTSPEFPVAPASARRLVWEKVPLFALSAASAVITVIAQNSTHTVASTARFPIAVRVANALYSYGMYLVNMFWPTRLALPYPHPGNALGYWKPALTLLFLGTLTAYAWRRRFVQSYLLTGWLWFLGTLVPVIGLLQVGEQAMADRYAYLPLIGIFVAVVWGISEFADRRNFAVGYRVVAAALVLTVLSALTWRQTWYWRSDYDLWSHSLAVTQDNYIAEDGMGQALIDLGRHAEALSHFQNALRINPFDARAHLNAGALLADQGHLQEAIPHFQSAALADQANAIAPVAYSNLGDAYRDLSDYPQASASYKEALRRNPELFSAFEGLGKLQLYKAISRLSSSMGTHPTASAYLQLGQLQQQAGRISDAHTAYQKAIDLNPKLQEAREALAALNSSNTARN